MTIKIKTDSKEIYKRFVDEFFDKVGFEETRGRFDGDRRQRRAGKYGEAIIIDEIGLDLETDYIEPGFPEAKLFDRPGGDYGIDVDWDGVHIDVKTLIVKVPVSPGISKIFYHNYNKGQAQDPDNKTDIIIFCIINIRERMLAVCGAISKQEMTDLEYSIARVKGEEKVRPGGSIHKYRADEYEIQQWQIVNFEKTQDMKGYIYAYGQYKKGDVNTFQRAEKKRISHDPEEEIHTGNGVPA